jgi:hypothetical protein
MYFKMSSSHEMLLLGEINKTKELTVGMDVTKGILSRYVNITALRSRSRKELQNFVGAGTETLYPIYFLL